MTETPTRSRRPKENGGKFKLLRGPHVEEGPKDCPCSDCLKDQDYADGKRERSRTHVYRAGEIVESEYDLEKRFNVQSADGRSLPDFQKFERLGAGSRHAPVPLAELSTQLLAAVALEEEIDLAGCKSKEDMVRRIEETRTSRAGGTPPGQQRQQQRQK